MHQQQQRAADRQLDEKPPGDKDDFRRQIRHSRCAATCLIDARPVPGQGSVEVAGGVARYAAVHGGLVRFTHGMRPAGHRGVERLKRHRMPLSGQAVRASVFRRAWAAGGEIEVADCSA